MKNISYSLNYYSKNKNLEITNLKEILKRNLIFKFFLIIFFLLSILLINIIYINLNILFNNKKNNLNFNYEYYENNTITDKMRNDSEWIITQREANFINGIIRKNKLKNCLEIGVANGGSSILILNAIKDIKQSVLVSLDLNDDLFRDPSKKTGYRVYEYFPELTKKWKLYTGDQPHKFLMKLNLKFDFLFLDTAHILPGELINLIEALPFLNDKAIIVIHDIIWHFWDRSSIKFYPSCSLLFPSIYGEKILLGNSSSEINNIGAVFLYPHQEKHYLDYFLLLLNFWEYMPSDNQINDLRLFIKEYYKNDIFLNIFNKAVFENQNSINRFKQSNYSSKEYKNIVQNLGKNNVPNIL